MTAWNGLMISAMVRAGTVLAEPRYVDAAVRAAQYVLGTNIEPGASNLLLRRSIAVQRDGAGLRIDARIPAYLDDYAFLIDGLIELYQAAFDPHWLDEAERLQVAQEQLFRAGTGYFSSAKGEPTMPERSREYFDNVTPAGNSIALLNLLRLSALTLKPAYREAADRLIRGLPEPLTRAPRAFPQLLMSLDYALDDSKEIAVAGDPAKPATRALVSALVAPFNLNKVIAVGDATHSSAQPLLARKSMKSGRPTVYVCLRSVCRLPTTEAAAARKLAEAPKRYKL